MGYSPWSRKELDMTKATKQHTQHSLILTLEKEIAARSNILAWEIPRTEEPGGIQSVHGVARVRNDLATKPPLSHTHSESILLMTQSNGYVETIILAACYLKYIFHDKREYF